MSIRKNLDFIQEIGSIMYVGGILSHIVIGVVLGHSDANTAYLVYVYKEKSAYILILSGLTLKIISDLILYTQFEIKPYWLKLKMLMMAFLSVNAFVFLHGFCQTLKRLSKRGKRAAKNEIRRLKSKF